MSHRVFCIQEEIQKDLLHLTSVTEGQGRFGSKLTFHANPGVLQLMLQNRYRLGNDLVDIQFHKLGGVRPGKAQEIIDDLRRSERLLDDLVHELVSFISGIKLLAKKLRVA